MVQFQRDHEQLNSLNSLINKHCQRAHTGREHLKSLEPGKILCFHNGKVDKFDWQPLIILFMSVKTHVVAFKIH